MEPSIIIGTVSGGLALLVALSGLRVIRDHERGVILRLGRRRPLLSPGLRWILPLGIDRLQRVDLRSSAMQLPRHEVITADGVPLQVTAAMHLQVVNPVLAVTTVVDHRASSLHLAEAAIREVASRMDLRGVLTDLPAFRDGVGRYVDERTRPWGIAITAVDVIEVDLPQAMREVMAHSVHSSADVTAARPRASSADAEEPTAGAGGAELEAAKRLVDAAQLLAEQPHAVQVRYLQELAQLSDSSSTVVVVPLPPAMAQPWADIQGRATRGAAAWRGNSTTAPAGAVSEVRTAAE